ncbi:hypothetical protein [Arthrobacter sp. U41]|uniref:hypothetical protein n=1 Tax=Arthrobacter sp. U41 TaxID=1849032 RepID=UPI0011A72AC0|nr:hypothetical protein [Arthrobacter sp. U41]
MAEGTAFVRVIRNAKRVSVVGGGVLVIAGGLGLWRTAVLLNEPEPGRVAALTGMLAVVAFIRGFVILFWDRRSTPSALMRPQAADALVAILPVIVVVSFVVALREIGDPASPALWLFILVLASATISVRPAKTASLLEIPPLRSMKLLDWVRIQSFGTGTLFIAVWFSVLYLTSPLSVDTWTPRVITTALVQAGVSIWRMLEQHHVGKTGPRLTGMQIIWLRAIHVNQGHAAAVRELRMMQPRIGTAHAERVIENLYRSEEK